MTYMHKNSRNFDMAGEPYRKLSGANVLRLRDKAKAHGVEWHHAAGHSKGRQIIGFYPKTEEERQAIDRLADLVEANNKAKAKERKALKEAGLPTSKKAVWEWLEKNGQKDYGFGSVDYKVCKYNYFVCEWGEPDGTFYFDNDQIADIARKILKL